MSIRKIDVGGQLFVFQSSLDFRRRNSCIIDAHGEQLFMGNTRGVEFEVPEGMTLHFYVPHGAPLAYRKGNMTFKDDPDNDYAFTTSLMGIMNGEAVETESFTEGTQCPDYELSKIQASSQGALGGSGSNFLGERNAMTYEDVVKFMNHGGQDAKEVVTIRNRLFQSDQKLSSVLALLKRSGHNYSHVHCCFCRSAKWMGSKPAVNPVPR